MQLEVVSAACMVWWCCSVCAAWTERQRTHVHGSAPIGSTLLHAAMYTISIPDCTVAMACGTRATTNQCHVQTTASLVHECHNQLTVEHDMCSFCRKAPLHAHSCMCSSAAVHHHLPDEEHHIQQSSSKGGKLLLKIMIKYLNMTAVFTKIRMEHCSLQV